MCAVGGILKAILPRARSLIPLTVSVPVCTPWYDIQRRENNLSETLLPDFEW